ncbi:Arc family DNA-binding protein [Micromonospora sp. WMMD754]|uniref:Arc family DNA-binding protein n=1 Tax=Micromonospora sp. WMMD754 TaxID=3404114 RepID=UPI003BF5DE65
MNLKPEVEQRLKELAEAEHRSMHKTVEVAVQAYLDRHERDEWTRQAARRVLKEDAEFFEMLGTGDTSLAGRGGPADVAR